MPNLSSEQLAHDVVRRLRAARHKAWLVGGCVRDLLLGRQPKDFDVATKQDLERVMTELINDGLRPWTLATYRAFIKRFYCWFLLPEEFPRIMGSKNIVEIEQIKLMEEIISALPLKTIRRNASNPKREPAPARAGGPDPDLTPFTPWHDWQCCS